MLLTALLLVSCSLDDPITIEEPITTITTTTMEEKPVEVKPVVDVEPLIEVLAEWEPITSMTTTTSLASHNQHWATVEAWRPEVTEAVTHFGGNSNDVDRFLHIMQCESGGDPLAKNPNSSASGLMQHLTRFWQERAESAGVPGADVFDGNSNIWVSAWLALAAPGGGWQHWVCK
jgi:hypothetical protein